MKTMQRFCATLLALMLIFGVFSLGIYAAEPATGDVLSASIDRNTYVVNEGIVLTAVTKDTVYDLGLQNESGKFLGKTGVSSVTNADGTKTWTVGFAIGSAGNNRVIKIFSRTKETTFVDSGLTVSATITKTAIPAFNGKVLSVENPEAAQVKTPFDVTVTTTTDVEKIRIVNESGKAVVPVSSTATVADGVKTWALSVSVGSSGVDRTMEVFAVNPATNENVGNNVKIIITITKDAPVIPEPPVEEETEAYKKLDENLVLTWESSSDIAGSSAGTYTLSTTELGSAGSYSLYFADKNGILEDYASFATCGIYANSLTAKYNKFIAENVFPAEATRIVAVKGGVIKAFYEIPQEKRFNPGKLLYTQAIFSDVHVFADKSNGINGYDELLPAIQHIKDLGVTFLNISGDTIMDADATQSTIENDFDVLLPLLDEIEGLDINICKGNHDKAINEDTWTEIWNHPVDYSFKHNGDTYIFMSLKTVNNVGSNDTVAYGDDKIEWLTQEMEKAAGGRIYLFMHYPLPDYAGLKPGESYGFTSSSTEDDRILDLIRRYGNTYIFGGHTHYDFASQDTYPNMMVKKIAGTNSYTIHTPSLAYPRISNGSQINYESQAYYAEVYEGGLVLKGFDMKQDKKFIPNGCYNLMTELNPYYLSKGTANVYTGRSTTVQILGGEYESAVWSSSNNNVVTVDNNGKLTGVAPGTATVSVVVNGITLTLSVKVSNATPISFPESAVLGIGEGGPIGLTGSYDTVVYSSSNESVAKVDANGNLTAYAAGTAVITAKVDGEDYTMNVTVVDAPAKYTGSGTQADPYVITTATQFVGMQKEMKNGTTFAGKYFIQAADINLNNCKTYEPMGDAGDTIFSGTYNGNGYVIKVTAPVVSYNFAPPLFWYIDGTIVNTGFDVNVKGCASTSYCIARELHDGAKMINCYLVGDLVGNNVSTAIIAGTSSGSTINNMYSKVGVTGTTPGSSSSGVSIKGSSNTVTNYYFVPNGCDTHYSGEKSVTVSGLATLASTLNTNASGINLDKIILCTWATKNNLPVLNHDGGYEAPETFAQAGTVSDPYIIATAADFVKLQRMNKGGETFSGKYFLQTANINLNDCKDYAPMSDAGNTIFAGTYNGNGYVLSVTVPKVSASFAPPFFWYLSGTVVNTGFNVDLKGCSSTAYSFCREFRGGKLLNCYMAGSMNCANSSTTLLAGTSTGATINNMYTYLTLSGTAPSSSNSGVSVKGTSNISVNNYYYVPNGCIKRFDGESSITVDGLATLATTLNSNANGLELFNISFCSWTTANNVPVLNHDGGYIID